jgi:SSS family solute:Na+ symporter
MFLDRSLIPAQPLTALKSDKDIFRMRILAQIIYGQATASVDDLAPLAKDRNLLIRRMALKALGKTMDPRAIPIIERGLLDPENCVRSIAAFALGLNHGPKSLNKLLATVEKYGNHSFNEITLTSLQKFGPAIKLDLIKVFRSSKNDMVRTLALRVLDKFTTEEDVPLLVIALDDPEQFARFTAAQALGNIRNSRNAAEALVKATLHNDPVVSDRAATSLAIVLSRKEPVLLSLRPQVLEALNTLYGKLGEGCKRIDAEWGYRPVGNALLAMGSEGEAVLKSFMLQTTDRRLAESAWKSLYIRQRPNSFSEVTEKENEEAFRMRPAFLYEQDSLRKQAIEQLQSNLRTQPKLIKVHAAEYLLWLGLDEPGEVKKIFTGEEQRFGTESPIRIPIWRVLAQTETDPQKKKVWIDKLLAAWKDTAATDRAAAAESLSKIDVSLLQEFPELTQKIIQGSKGPLSTYTFWSASIGITGADAIRNNRAAFMDLLSPGQDDNVKAVAAYSLRHLGGLTDKEWSRLAACALYEPIKPLFKVYMVSAAFVTAPEDSLQCPAYTAIRKELLQNKYSPRTDDQKELAAAISEKGMRADLPVLVSLLHSDDPDVRSAAAYAILKMDRRSKLFKN